VRTPEEQKYYLEYGRFGEQRPRLASALRNSAFVRLGLLIFAAGLFAFVLPLFHQDEQQLIVVLFISPLPS
jgi:hypothetical protein